MDTENIDNLKPTEGLKAQIDWNLYQRLRKLGIITCLDEDCRNYNIGSSDYSKHTIQPWSIWIDWELNAFDADIVKRVLRTKKGTSRIEDYEKIIHICNERIRQLNDENRNNEGHQME